MLSKFCNNCKKEKCISEFHKNKSKPNGYNSQCKECRNTYKKLYKILHPEKFKKYKRKYQSLNKGKIMSKYRQVKYNLNDKAFNKMVENQNNKCAICESDFSDVKQFTKPHVDHDHKTGKIRGILCGYCNTAIGLLKDSPIILDKAIKYLQNQNK